MEGAVGIETTWDSSPAGLTSEVEASSCTILAFFFLPFLTLGEGSDGFNSSETVSFSVPLLITYW